MWVLYESQEQSTGTWARLRLLLISLTLHLYRSSSWNHGIIIRTISETTLWLILRNSFFPQDPTSKLNNECLIQICWEMDTDQTVKHLWHMGSSSSVSCPSCLQLISLALTAKTTSVQREAGPVPWAVCGNLARSCSDLVWKVGMGNCLGF